jgi:hypothetical protein
MQQRPDAQTICPVDGLPQPVSGIRSNAEWERACRVTTASQIEPRNSPSDMRQDSDQSHGCRSLTQTFAGVRVRCVLDEVGSLGAL